MAGYDLLSLPFDIVSQAVSHRTVSVKTDGTVNKIVARTDLINVRLSGFIRLRFELGPP